MQWGLEGGGVVAEPSNKKSVDPSINILFVHRLKQVIQIRRKKLNPNLLSYWECCRNMVRKKKFEAGNKTQRTSKDEMTRLSEEWHSYM